MLEEPTSTHQESHDGDADDDDTEDSLVDSLTDILRRADARWNGCGNPYIVQAQAVIRELKLQPQEGTSST